MTLKEFLFPQNITFGCINTVTDEVYPKVLFTLDKLRME